MSCYRNTEKGDRRVIHRRGRTTGLCPSPLRGGVRGGGWRPRASSAPKLAALAVAAVLLAAPPALAQQSSVAEIAAYQGPDRQQRLLEGAKKEKELTFYSSVPPADIAALVAGFDKQYEVDIAAGAASALEPLYRENLLQEVKSPALADIIPQAIPPHGQWVAIYLSLFVQAYNTNLISKESLPASYADLVRPQWKDKLAVEADDFDWFAETVKDMGEERGLRLFREIVAANGISVRKGHSLLNNLVAAGEVPLALSDYGYLAEQAKRKGAPLDWLVIPPAIARATAQGLVRNAPHPYAAVLFYDYLISGAQPIFAGRQFIPVSRNLQPPYNVGRLKLIDSAAMLDVSRKWQDLFQKTIIGPSR